jgi:hypothetical protein
MQDLGGGGGINKREPAYPKKQKMKGKRKGPVKCFLATALPSNLF